MRLRSIIDDDDAVSPVIGVILMVAITVILAAVIASFVLGLGGKTKVAPKADFSINYDGGESGSDSGFSENGLVTVSHNGGASVKVTELYVRGSGTNETGQWDKLTNFEASGDIGGTSAVVSGNSVTLEAKSDYDIEVVWQAAEGDKSATLAEDTGPDA